MLEKDYDISKRGDFTSFLSKQTHIFCKPDEENLNKIIESFNYLTSQLGGDIFLSDGMLLWGREIGWVQDEDFIKALKITKPRKNELSVCWRTHILCWAAKQAEIALGDYFEFGCYKGFSASVIRSYCQKSFQDNLNKSYYWFDLFESNKKEKIQIMDQSDSQEIAKERSSLFNDTYVLKGDVRSTYIREKVFLDKKVAFAHFDLNDFETEFLVLENVMKKVSSKSVLVFDDFGMSPFRRQNRMYRKYFSEISIPILELPTGQGVVIIP